MDAPTMLTAIKEGRATHGYRPKDGHKKNSYEDWVAVDGEEIEGGMPVLLELADGHKITKSLQMHLNFGAKGGAATYALGYEGEKD